MKKIIYYLMIILWAINDGYAQSPPSKSLQIVLTESHPRIDFGVEKLRKALNDAGYKTTVTKTI
ncbi:MAG: hypothetical protein ACK41O_25975, partial [Runella zeae]